MAGFTRVGHHTSAATYAYWSDLAVDGYEWYFHPNACCGVIPTNDGQACVFACALPARIGRGGVAVIRDIVAESAPQLAARLQAATAPRGARTWRGHHGYIRRSYGPGWALVGDAAYYKDPISAHGLTDALRDAELLARALNIGFDDAASLDDALADYEATRDRLSIPLFDVVDRVASQQWDNAEIAHLLRQLSSAMTDEVETLADFESEVQR
jgi:2-polyprenyl-6-methoxyphenol hydroxylase-like FAD-dependent oxidoreductase